MAVALIRIRLDDSEVRAKEAARQRSAAKQIGQREGADYIVFDEGRDYAGELEGVKERERDRKRKRRERKQAAFDILTSESPFSQGAGLAQTAAIRKLGGGRLQAAMAIAKAAPGAMAAGQAVTGVGTSGISGGLVEGLKDRIQTDVSRVQGLVKGGMEAASFAEQLADLGIKVSAKEAVQLGAQQARVARAQARQEIEFSEDKRAQTAKGLAESPQLALLVVGALKQMPQERLEEIFEPVVRALVGRGR